MAAAAAADKADAGAAAGAAAAAGGGPSGKNAGPPPPPPLAGGEEKGPNFLNMGGREDSTASKGRERFRERTDAGSTGRAAPSGCRVRFQENSGGGEARGAAAGATGRCTLAVEVVVMEAPQSSSKKSIAAWQARGQRVANAQMKNKKSAVGSLRMTRVQRVRAACRVKRVGRCLY